MPRGGKRTGAPGKAYSNRSDLNGPAPIGNYAKSGPYGTGVALSNAQRAVPVSAPPQPQQQVQGAPQLQQGGGPPAVQGVPTPPPGGLGPLNRPTDRPNEPLTHGLPTGPGAGPEVMQNNPANTTAASLLQRMALQPAASPEVRALANVFAQR